MDTRRRGNVKREERKKAKIGIVSWHSLTHPNSEADDEDNDGDAVIEVGHGVARSSGCRVCRRTGGGSLIVRIEGRHHCRQLISLLLFFLRVPTSYSSNTVVVAVVHGGFSGNADISSTI